MQTGRYCEQIQKAGHDSWREGDGHSRVTGKVCGRMLEKVLFSVFDACVMWVNIRLLYPARSSVNGLETCAIFSITHMQIKNHFRFRHFRFPAPQVIFGSCSSISYVIFQRMRCDYVGFAFTSVCPNTLKS